jgi:UDP:flavonoid glycosyltransferase YjiC (YdhE family)
LKPLLNSREPDWNPTEIPVVNCDAGSSAGAVHVRVIKLCVAGAGNEPVQVCVCVCVGGGGGVYVCES